MYFEDLSDKATCPYNKNHVFDKEKLIFHLNRCKDKEKVANQYDSCRFNRIHIHLKGDDLKFHEDICPDRDDIKKLTKQLK